MARSKTRDRKPITNQYYMLNIFFPILKILEDLQWNSCDIISQNNYQLSKELEGMPPMSGQEIKEYVNNL